MAPRPSSPAFFRSLGTLSLVLVTALSGRAAQPKEPATDLDRKAFFKPELSISTSHVPLTDALPRLANRGAWESLLADRGDDLRNPRLKAWLDPRSGAATNLLGAFPLVPGRGVGNQVSLRELASALRQLVGSVDETVAAVRSPWHRGAWDDGSARDGARPEGDRGAVAGQHPAGRRGVPVVTRGSCATISHGNLVVVGTEV
jgi:hypothetical protein